LYQAKPTAMNARTAMWCVIKEKVRRNWGSRG